LLRITGNVQQNLDSVNLSTILLLLSEIIRKRKTSLIQHSPANNVLFVLRKKFEKLNLEERNYLWASLSGKITAAVNRGHITSEVV